MSSAGHIIDAINRITYNRRQLLVRRERYSVLKNKYEISIKSKKLQFKNDTIPKEILEDIKMNIRKQIQKQKRRAFLISLSLTILIVMALIALINKYVAV